MAGSNTNFGNFWTTEEDLFIWNYYVLEKKNDSEQASALLAEQGWQRSPLAIRSRIFKLRHQGFGKYQEIQRLANNLPWR